MNKTSRYARRLWGDKATIWGQEDYKVGSITKRREVILYEDQPCKLSFGSVSPTSQSRSSDNMAQVVKLFISKDLMIPAGSKIVVTRGDRVLEYKNSSEPAVFTRLTSTQEITLDLWKGWA